MTSDERLVAKVAQAMINTDATKGQRSNTLVCLRDWSLSAGFFVAKAVQPQHK
jgi:hypothetical protein